MNGCVCKVFDEHGLSVPKIAATALPFLVFDTSRFIFCMVFNCCLERDSECNEFIAQHVEFMPFKMAQCSILPSVSTNSELGEKSSSDIIVHSAAAAVSGHRSVNDWCCTQST